MLKHEETQDLPAASQRVTAEELSRAVSALDEARAAEQINGTTPIGQVVEELNLDATPDEIWAQVQRQRAGAATKTASVPKARVSSAVRRRVRGWRGIGVWAWVLFWCCGGVGVVSHFTHLGGPPAGVVISGDAQTLTSATAGKSVEVSGSGDTLTLTGDCPVLTISGDANTVRVEGRVGKVVADGDSNVVIYTAPPAPILSGGGDGTGGGASAVRPPAPILRSQIIGKSQKRRGRACLCPLSRLQFFVRLPRIGAGGAFLFPCNNPTHKSGILFAVCLFYKTTCEISQSSPTLTTAKRPSWTECSSRVASSAPIRPSLSVSWTRWTSSASAASPSFPSTRPSPTATPRSTSWTPPDTPTLAARSSVS